MLDSDIPKERGVVIVGAGTMGKTIATTLNKTTGSEVILVDDLKEIRDFTEQTKTLQANEPVTYKYSANPEMPTPRIYPIGKKSRSDHKDNTKKYTKVRKKNKRAKQSRKVNNRKRK